MPLRTYKVFHPALTGRPTAYGMAGTNGAGLVGGHDAAGIFVQAESPDQAIRKFCARWGLVHSIEATNCKVSEATTPPLPAEEVIQ